MLSCPEPNCGCWWALPPAGAGAGAGRSKQAKKPTPLQGAAASDKCAVPDSFRNLWYNACTWTRARACSRSRSNLHLDVVVWRDVRQNGRAVL